MSLPIANQKTLNFRVWDRVLDYASGDQMTRHFGTLSQVALVPEAYDWNAAPPTLPDADGRYPIPVPGVTTVL